MREYSQEKGRKYQRSIKSWLCGNSLFGYNISEFGDAYDLSKKSTSIGGVYFDFSLKLCDNKDLRKIAYAECKFRNELSGNINSQFKEFISNVYKGLLHSEIDEISNSEFIFISNIPPDEWRTMINKKTSYIKEIINTSHSDCDEEIINVMNGCLHVFILSEKMVLNRG